MIDFTPFPVSDLNPEGVERTALPGTGAFEFTFPKGQGELWAEMKDGALDGLYLGDGRWLAMDVTCLGTRAAVFSWFFVTADGRFCGVKMGVLPGVPVRIALPVEEITQGKNLFLRRTPGKLKSVTQGQPIDFREAVRFSVRSERAPEDVVFRIENCRVYEGEPDFPVRPKTLVDEFGQKAIADWPGKTHSFEEMAERMKKVLSDPAPKREDDGRSRWGGDLSLRLTDGTGFFTLEKWNGRYLLADPDGYAFFSTGLDCVNIDGDANLEGIRCLAGELDPESAKLHLIVQPAKVVVLPVRVQPNQVAAVVGPHTVACWSDLDFARAREIPHVTIMRGYPRTETYIFRDFPDVLSPEFRTNAEEWAKQILPQRDVRSLIGYFLGNEPQWAFVNGLNIAAFTLECEKSSASRKALIEYMRNEYGSIGALNAEWGSDYASFEDMDRPVGARKFSEAGLKALNRFSEIMIREYIRIPSLAIRKLDPNHLNLGIRYAWLSSKELAAGAEFTDVFSFNCYSMDPTDSIESFSKLVGKPVMIGEFHFGALDRGLDATGIRGVTTQAERGAAYRYYMQKAAAHPMCLGAAYFTLNDQAYLGRFDGENYQIGVVDVTQRPYEDFEAGIVETHREIYEIAEGKKPADARKAEEIPAIFF